MPSYIRPWYWNIPFEICERLAPWLPNSRLRCWANRATMWITDHYGPFAHGRGWYCTIHKASGPH